MATMAMATAALASGAEARTFLDLSREAIRQLAVLLRNSYLHDLSNQVFEEPRERLSQALSRLLISAGSFRLERVGEEFFANGVRLRMEIKSLHAYKYVLHELAKRELGGLLVEARLAPDELTVLLEVLSRSRDVEDDATTAMNGEIESRGLVGVKLLPPREEPLVSDRGDTSDRRKRALDAYQQALDFIRESMARLDSPAQLDLRKAKRTVQRIVDLGYEEGDGFSLAGLASIKGHDNYTFNHMVNVCILAIAFGHRLGFQRQELAQIGLCAMYHDMGKLHIPLEVLNKTSGLTEEEWATMGNHTVYAARTLFPLIEGDPGTVHRILTALQHHVRYDGTGYPELRIRRRQSLYARITAIVDTFDAMTTKRVYQRQHLPDEAIAVLYQGAGTFYDPLLVKAFINCMGVFPVGSTVVLATGELAVVVESNPDPSRVHQPRVRLVTDAARRMVQPRLADLSLPGEARRGILHCVDAEQFGINSAHYVV